MDCVLDDTIYPREFNIYNDIKNAPEIEKWKDFLLIIFVVSFRLVSLQKVNLFV